MSVILSRTGRNGFPVSIETDYGWTISLDDEEFESLREQINALHAEMEKEKFEADMKQKGFVRARLTRDISYINPEDLWVKPEKDQDTWYFICYGSVSGNIHTRDLEVIDDQS